jgi:hypothetical protein
LAVGVAGEIGWFQGNVNLTGFSQRRGRAIDVGASYAVAPGFTVYAEISGRISSRAASISSQAPQAVLPRVSTTTSKATFWP